MNTPAPWPIRYFAHRGAWEKEYEQNTEIAFRRAIQRHAEGVELDVWNVKGVLKVAHDREAAGKKGTPSFEGILDAINDEAEKLQVEKPVVNIELKGIGTAGRLIRIMKERKEKYDKCLVSAFIEKRDKTKKIILTNELNTISTNSNFPIALLVRDPRNVKWHIAIAKKIKACAISLFIRNVQKNPEYVDAIKNAGLSLYGYSIRWSEREKYSALPVDGFFVDNYGGEVKNG